MASASDKHFAVYMEGHEGHRGNVLAHAWVAKVQNLLSVFARLERRFLDSSKRQTVFEVTDTEKRNPTIINLKAVPAAKDYDPEPAFQWTLDQIENVATGRPVDERIDAETADMLAGLARPVVEDGYKKFWINGRRDAVVFDAAFMDRARQIAATRRLARTEPGWFAGTAHGSIVGEIRAIDDVQGERSFIVVPAVGPQQIDCRFPESMRDEMGKYVFRTVRVTGLLTYSADSPFPKQVEMATIEAVTAPDVHMVDLEGLFAGHERNSIDYSALLHE